MKRKLVIFMACNILLTSCQSDDKRNDENQLIDEFIESMENSKNEINEEIIEKEDYEIELTQLSGKVIVRPQFQAIVCTDGSVLTKGRNSYGELGNGGRVDSYEWGKVEGLENVKGIYASVYFGEDYNYNSVEIQHCYALTEDGKVYRWGANILTPQEVTIFPEVEEIEQTGPTFFIIRCRNGETYLMETAYFEGDDDKIIACHSLDKNAKMIKLRTNEDGCLYMLLEESNVYYIYTEYLSDFSRRGEFYVYDIAFEDGIIEKVKIETDSPIVDINENYMLTESGKVLEVETVKDVETLKENSIELHDLGGSGCIKVCLEGESDFTLFSDGELHCYGDNEYGQLGDGTYLDYEEGFLVIENIYFNDFYVGYHSEYVVALDYSNNVLCWGRGFGNTPEIIISENEFKGFIE